LKPTWTLKVEALTEATAETRATAAVEKRIFAK
jgi:hypothetical protein